MQTDLFKEAIVWSKVGCQACDTVKALLREYNFNIEERNVDTLKGMADFKSMLPASRTVPQIIINGKHIGGLVQVRQYLER